MRFTPRPQVAGGIRGVQAGFGLTMTVEDDNARQAAMREREARHKTAWEALQKAGWGEIRKAELVHHQDENHSETYSSWKWEGRPAVGVAEGQRVAVILIGPKEGFRLRDTVSSVRVPDYYSVRLVEPNSKTPSVPAKATEEFTITEVVIFEAVPALTLKKETDENGEMPVWKPGELAWKRVSGPS